MITTEFALDQGIVHLNHAAVAPWPRRTSEAVCRFAEENRSRGSQRYLRWMAVEQELRAQLRWLINAPDADDIALLKNTSEGLSVVAHGLDWKPGQNVVTSRQEFPSNRIVWQSLESRFGVEARLADLSAADDPEAELFALVDDNTRVIAISAVQYATGLRMDLARIGAFCRERKILFCVDAIQQLGALPFDVQTVQADFVVADGHKWMLGPEGIALFYARPELRDTLGLHQYGWHMVEHAHDFDREDWEPAYSARRFECGSPNMLGIHGLQASLSLIRETGLEIISENISKNIQYLIEKLEEKNMEILSDLRPERRSGILTFRPPGDVAAVYEHLQGQGVLCALRGGGIRFSPHYYTSREDMDRALTLLTGA